MLRVRPWQFFIVGPGVARSRDTSGQFKSIAATLLITAPCVESAMDLKYLDPATKMCKFMAFGLFLEALSHHFTPFSPGCWRRCLGAGEQRGRRRPGHASVSLQDGWYCTLHSDHVRYLNHIGTESIAMGYSKRLVKRNSGHRYASRLDFGARSRPCSWTLGLRDSFGARAHRTGCQDVGLIGWVRLKIVTRLAEPLSSGSL